MSVLLTRASCTPTTTAANRWHERARRLIQTEQRVLVLPSSVIPEIDHLLGHRLGAESRRLFYAGMVDGYYLVADLPRGAYARVADLHRQFGDLDLGFVDAAIFALAETLGLTRVATTDRRHFAPLAAAFALELLP